MNQESAQETIIALERAIQERWCKGDPFGYSEKAADDITYFDHLTQARVDGIAALKDHLRQFEGKVDVPKCEMLNPHVRLQGDLGVLTFNWYSYSSDGEVTSRWNTTEVYQRRNDHWQIVHMHWSEAKAPTTA